MEEEEEEEEEEQEVEDEEEEEEVVEEEEEEDEQDEDEEKGLEEEDVDDDEVVEDEEVEGGDEGDESVLGGDEHKEWQSVVLQDRGAGLVGWFISDSEFEVVGSKSRQVQFVGDVEVCTVSEMAGDTVESSFDSSGWSMWKREHVAMLRRRRRRRCRCSKQLRREARLESLRLESIRLRRRRKEARKRRERKLRDREKNSGSFCCGKRRRKLKKNCVPSERPHVARGDLKHGCARVLTSGGPLGARCSAFQSRVILPDKIRAGRWVGKRRCVCVLGTVQVVG